MSTAARVTAHAKLNLTLRVGERGPDGFHPIHTTFLRIALGDDLVVRVRPAGRSIDCRGMDVGPPERNLAMRAADAYAEAAGWPAGFAIEIDKRIPAGGGLGGGSADAGAVLRALDALAPAPISAPALLRIAARLGSDVPYLTTVRPAAVAVGRGERLRQMVPLGVRPVALVWPSFGVSTADAYAWLDADREEAGWRPASFLDAIPLRWDDVAAVPRNDLEPPVSRRHPEIAAIIARMREAGARVAGMTGSGSTVFGVFEQSPDAEVLARAGLPSVVMTRTLDKIEAVQLLD